MNFFPDPNPEPEKSFGTDTDPTGSGSTTLIFLALITRYVAYSNPDQDWTRIHKVYGYRSENGIKKLIDRKDTQKKFYVLKS
jgi:hypothetical protein